MSDRKAQFMQDYFSNLPIVQMHWKSATILICLYGVVKEFRPATPFLTPFLVSGYKNLTLEEVYSSIYPFWTYSYMLSLIPVFFMTDVLRYKPMIVIEAFTLCLTWALLTFGQGVLQMQIVQCIFGLSSAAEIAYYSYMYAVVDEKRYKTVTSYIRTASLVGKLFAFALAQFLVSTDTGSYLLLNQISLVAVTLSCVIAIFLPSVPTPSTESDVTDNMLRIEEPGLLDSEEIDKREITRAEFERTKMRNGVREYFNNTKKGFSIYYNSRFVLKWSIWWALASCGVFQILNYMQTLWAEFQPDKDHVANGVVEFSNTLFGAILSFGIQYQNINWLRHGEWVLCLSSLLLCAALAIVSQAQNVLVGYVVYIFVTSVYRMLMTVSSANIASELTSSNYGLVFGWNTFVALVLQSILTFVVVDTHGLHLGIQTQFVVYAAYFGFIGIVFLAFVFISRSRCTQSEESVDELSS